MAVTPEEVKHIASLAHLRLEEREVQEMSEQLSSILDHIAELRQVDVEGVPPVASVVEQTSPMRSDIPGPDPLHHPPQAFAPAWDPPFFVVPRLAALDAGDSPAAAPDELSP